MEARIKENMHFRIPFGHANDKLFWRPVFQYAVCFTGWYC